MIPIITVGMAIAWLVIVGLLSVAAAITFRGGLLWWVFGIEAVTSSGARASRLRLLGRSLLAWSTVLLLPLTLAMLTPLVGVAVAIGILALLQLGLTVWSLCLLQRGLPDRLTGTWLVPA